MNNYEFCATYIKKNAAGRPIVALDYGCGAGEIVTNLREMGIDASGCVVFYKGGDYSSKISSQLFVLIIKPMENGIIPFSDEASIL